MKTFEVRDPVHGFVQFNDLEREIINSPHFQRLRRIRQLSWTDQVYPGAMHTRFEHTLGVMHVSSLLFDNLVRSSSELFRTEFQMTENGLSKARQTIRIAALVHDLGHGPFSHASEDVFPIPAGSKKPIKHEAYSVYIAERYIDDILRAHPYNANNFGINISDVISLISGSGLNSLGLIWRELISGQMDADRMDYLLRDSYHAGVAYGKFDLDRVANSVLLCTDEEETSFQLGYNRDSSHTLEQLIIARYMMFTQVYFHKTRAIYDYHYTKFLSEVLPNGVFPSPEGDGLEDYCQWDDWRVLGLLHAGAGGEHGEILASRDHHRLVYRTAEVPEDDEITETKELMSELSELSPVEKSATSSWYKFARNEVLVTDGASGGKGSPLSTLSSVVRNLGAVDERRIYVPSANKNAAERVVRLKGGDLK